MHNDTRVYFVGLPCDIRMKISEILDHTDQTHTHVEENKEHSNHLGTHIEDKH